MLRARGERSGGTKGRENAQGKVDGSHLGDARDVDTSVAAHIPAVERRDGLRDRVRGGVALPFVLDVAFRFEERDERAVKERRDDEVEISWDPVARLEESLEDRRAADDRSRVLEHLAKIADLAKVRSQETAESHACGIDEERAELGDSLGEVDDFGEGEVRGEHAEEVVGDSFEGEAALEEVSSREGDASSKGTIAVVFWHVENEGAKILALAEAIQYFRGVSVDLLRSNRKNTRLTLSARTVPPLETPIKVSS